MDGPLFPDYQSRDVLLDLKPFIDRDGYDLTQLADQGVADFTTADGGQYGLPRDLNTIALYYNKAMFDAAGIAVPRRHLGLGEARRGREAADQGRRRRRQDRPVGLLHRDHRHGELLAVDGVAERRRRARAGRQVHRARHRPGRRRHPVPPGPDLEGQGHARPGRVRRDRRRVRAGRRPPWRPTARGWCRRSRRPASTSAIAPLPKGPAGRFTSVNPTGAVVYKGSKAPDAAWEFVEVPRQPGRAGAADAAQGVAAGEQGGPRRAVRHRRSTARRCSPTASRTRSSSRRSRATTSSRRRSRTSSTRTCSTPRTRRPRTRWRPSCRQLNALLAGQ